MSGRSKQFTPYYRSRLATVSMGVYGDLTRDQWAALLPIGIACGLVGFGIRFLLDKKSGGCNPSVKKSESKVVNSVDIEDLGDKTAFCRCWRSGKFPYCDGTHNKYNEECGDNVGPLIVKKSK